MSKGSRNGFRGEHYFLLLLVITVGVSAGNLASNWITARAVEWQARQILSEFNERMRQQSERSQDAREQREMALRRQRAESAVGTRLARMCSDWRQTDQLNSTYTTRTEKERHCSIYEDYLRTGSSPR